MYRNRQTPIQHEITSQEQQENSDRVIENMEEFSAEKVSGLDKPTYIINQLKNYITSGLKDNERTEFINILNGVLNSDDKNIDEEYKIAVRRKLGTLHIDGGARKRRKSRSRSKSKRTKSRSRNKSKSRK